METHVRIGDLQVATALRDFVAHEALPGSGISQDEFWTGLTTLIRDLGPDHRAALTRRDDLQKSIDTWHRENPGTPEATSYLTFLRSIGYVLDEPADVTVITSGVDAELTSIPGPQLVVPASNARFAVNAVNARWGSLYDALYGSDVIPHAEASGPEGYDPARGAQVIERARQVLDDHVPLDGASHRDATGYAVDAGGLLVTTEAGARRLADPAQLVGFRGDASHPDAVVLVHHGLHLEIQVDRGHDIGSTDAAGVKDVVIESAVSTIIDLEDSVAAVDAEDKVHVYRSWMSLMDGSLSAEVSKGGTSFTRTMSKDRAYVDVDGATFTLPARSLLFVRQVGHLMTSDIVLDGDGNEVPEGLLDAVFTALGSLCDLQGRTTRPNSRAGSMYVVKPKMHGPEEVALAVRVFARVEELLGLPPLTIKVGIMDEERRTSLNLKACIAEAKDRIVFINTGFLDRTGDEIHTSMQAGPMVPKAQMRQTSWIAAYEDLNVDIGLECGMLGRGQIGKGMWAAPDSLRDMYDAKIAHPRAGATCAWVPSPTAATIHALHYHQVDVLQRQRELSGTGRRAEREALLALPLGDPTSWTAEDRQAEIDNNLQSLLGYVVRWVDAGVGCSKVPDISGEPLMEDRATCRISAQHVANWLHHGVVTEPQVEETLRKMASVVDGQNATDPAYSPMAPSFDGVAFAAARALVLDGLSQPSGYTEPVLHDFRKRLKSQTTTEA